VVLSSAEVSTRSAEVAANISEEMRSVMLKVDDMSKRNVLHSRVMLVGLLSFLMIAVGTFFAISTRLQQNIRQLDTLSLAVGKRVVELDATIAAFGDATHGLGDTTEKLDGMEERQVKLDGKFETKMEDLTKMFNKMPDQIAGQVNGQSEKSLDAKLQNLQKSIQAVEAKMQALSAKPATPTPAPVQNNQAVIAEIQKLKKDLETALAANQVATKAAYDREKAAEKAAIAAARNPPLSLTNAPEGKSAETKAAELKAAQAKLAEAKAAEAKAAEAKAKAKAAAEATAAEDAKAAEAKAKADAKAAEARAKAIEAKAAAERAAAASQAPAIPPRAQPKEDRVVYPRANTDN
jgi:chemotaxis protein histidine kinase CheA